MSSKKNLKSSCFQQKLKKKPVLITKIRYFKLIKPFFLHLFLLHIIEYYFIFIKIQSGVIVYV